MTADVNIEFPQYRPQWTETRDGFNVTLTARCPQCSEVVTERTWIRLDETPIDNDILRKQSKEDGEKFMAHLSRYHISEQGGHIMGQDTSGH